MGNKSFRSRFGRFWWLWFIVAILSYQIGFLLAFGEWPTQFGVEVLIATPFFIVGIYLYNKTLESDNKNNISITPFRNIFLPWSKAAIWLSILALVELIISTPLFAYTFYPCSGLETV